MPEFNAPTSPAPTQAAAPGWRLLAFALDFILIATLCIVVLESFLLERYHGMGLGELSEILMTTMTANGGSPNLSVEAQGALQFMQTFMLSLFWLYFAASEWLMGGATLGKRIFRLHAAKFDLSYAPNAFESLLRGGIKAISLIWIPIGAINFIIMIVNPRNRAGHDLLARTWVVNDTGQASIRQPSQ
jgi:uncharacterized RDD family membrane protein YckC